MEYLALPLVLRDGFLSKCDLKESITYSVGLLLSTRLGSIPFRPEYGCDLWDKEYADLYSANKADIRASLRNAIARFEPRLFNASVSFSYGEEADAKALGMSVKVVAKYMDGDEEKNFEGTFGLE